jgi:hypothetical protein
MPEWFVGDVAPVCVSKYEVQRPECGREAEKGYGVALRRTHARLGAKSRGRERGWQFVAGRDCESELDRRPWGTFGKLPPDDGRVLLDGTDLASFKRSAVKGMWGHEIVLLNREGPKSHWKTERYVGLALWMKQGNRAATRAARYAVEAADTADCIGRTWEDLSHWQRVLVELARAFAGANPARDRGRSPGRARPKDRDGGGDVAQPHAPVRTRLRRADERIRHRLGAARGLHPRARRARRPRTSRRPATREAPNHPLPNLPHEHRLASPVLRG